MVFIIDPCNLTANTAPVLRDFLLNQIHNKQVSWLAGVPYPFPADATHLDTESRLCISDDLLFRERKPGTDNCLKLGWRIEVYNRKTGSIGSGTQADVYQTRGTLALTENSLTFQQNKQRVIKLFKGRSDYRLEAQANPPHLHSKRPVLLPKTDPAYWVGIVMRRMPGINLTHIVDQTTSAQPLSSRVRATLSQRFLATYQSQVALNGMVHRDIKPDNIMVKLSLDPLSIELSFIDYGVAHPLGSSILSPSMRDSSKTSSTQSPTPDGMMMLLFPPQERRGVTSSNPEADYRVSPSLEKSPCEATGAAESAAAGPRTELSSTDPKQSEELPLCCFFNPKGLKHSRPTPITGFEGTPGFIPAEGYANIPPTRTYDYFSLAKILGMIWGVAIQSFGPLMINLAKLELLNLSYKGKISPSLIPSESIRCEIETILTQMSLSDPAERPSMDLVQGAFNKLEHHTQQIELSRL